MIALGKQSCRNGCDDSPFPRSGESISYYLFLVDFLLIIHYYLSVIDVPLLLSCWSGRRAQVQRARARLLSPNFDALTTSPPCKSSD